MAESVRSVDGACLSGHLSGPSHTSWRRQRLLRIGSNNTTTQIPLDGDETSALRPSQTSYGTLPTRQDSPASIKRTFRQRRNLPALPGLTLPRVSSLNLPRVSTCGSSNPVLPPLSPSSFRGIPNSYLRINAQRPITAYDAPLAQQNDIEDDLHARNNGIRVWYSSFSSIDWLHDAIKDSVRHSRLSRGRSRVRLLVDKSMGWIIVTLVGFITALIAFLIIRSEQWLFDLKDGYCRAGWTMAKRFCCPIEDVDGKGRFYMGAVAEDMCDAWKTWAEVFRASERGDHRYWAEIVQYVSYAFIAVCLHLCVSRCS